MKTQIGKLGKQAIFGIAVIGSILIVITSCSKPKDGAVGPAGAQGSSGPLLQGNLQGFVQLFDQYGTRLYTKLDSASVSIDGTSSSSMTDINGKYSFSNLNTGTYNFSINGRTSFASSKLQGIEVTGNGTIDRDVKLSQIPNWTLNAITAIDTVVAGIHNLKVKITLPTADVKARELSLFISASSGVTPTNYTWNYNITIPANATTVNKVVAANTVFLSGDNLPSGSTIYLSAYPAAVGYTSNSTFIDYNTGKVIYNALNINSGASNQVQIQ